MTKDQVLKKLEEYKGRPVEIFLDNANYMYIGVEGHWVFEDETGLTEIAVNTAGVTPGVAGMTQNESPFVILHTEWDTIQYIRGYIGPYADKIIEITQDLKPIATDKTLKEIQDEIVTSQVMLSKSPTTFNRRDEVATDSYGQFTGSAISTSKDGVPYAIKKMAENQSS